MEIRTSYRAAGQRFEERNDPGTISSYRTPGEQTPGAFDPQPDCPVRQTLGSDEILHVHVHRDLAIHDFQKHTRPVRQSSLSNAPINSAKGPERMRNTHTHTLTLLNPVIGKPQSWTLAHCRIDSNSNAVNQINLNANADGRDQDIQLVNTFFSVDDVKHEAEPSGAVCGDNPPFGIA